MPLDRHTPKQIANPHNSPHYCKFIRTTVGSRIMNKVRFSTKFKEEPMRLLNISQEKGDFQIHFPKCLAHPHSRVGASQDTAPGSILFENCGLAGDFICMWRRIRLALSNGKECIRSPQGTGVRWASVQTPAPRPPCLAWVIYDLITFCPQLWWGCRLVKVAKICTAPSTLVCSYRSVVF